MSAGTMYPRTAYPSADDALAAAGLPDGRVRLVWTVPGNSWSCPWVGFPMWGALACWLVERR